MKCACVEHTQILTKSNPDGNFSNTMQILVTSPVSVHCAHSPGLRDELCGRIWEGDPGSLKSQPQGDRDPPGQGCSGSESIGTSGSLCFCLLALAAAQSVPEQLSQACPEPQSAWQPHFPLRLPGGWMGALFCSSVLG